MTRLGSERTASRGSAAERDRPTVTGGCPLERALELIGTRSAMTLLREAFYGARRFDDLVGRAGLSSMAGSARLKEFVAAGLMFKRPYESPYGTRCEYVLTDLGNECLPVVLAMMRFGAAIETASQTAELRPDGDDTARAISAAALREFRPMTAAEQV